MQDKRYIGDSIFWIDISKIDPNPFQPRREFDEARLKDLSESIRQYGVLQPLVVTKTEIIKEDGGGLQSRYELIAGERRLRASKLAGLTQVPAVIRSGADDSRTKLELAIIENLQREDLNPIDRARAFQRLVKEFGFKNKQVAEKIGKSSEYVSNTMRLLDLPEEMLQALSLGKITEGHTRPLLMLGTRPEEQNVLFKEIMYKKLSVRESESLARRVAVDKVRKKEYKLTPEIVEMESKLTESLGTRVKIEAKENGGQIVIDYFSPEDLHSIVEVLKTNESKKVDHLLNSFIEKGGQPLTPSKRGMGPLEVPSPEIGEEAISTPIVDADDRSAEEKKKSEDELYSVKNFSI